MEFDDSANPSVKDLLAAVGEFLLCWGWLENALESALDSPQIPIELEPIRHMRNNLCHRLLRAHADPWEEPSTAYVECCAKDGELVKYSFQEIETAIRCLRVGSSWLMVCGKGAPSSTNNS